MSQRSLHAAQVLWPAFLMAGILEMVVFAFVDPTALHLGNWRPDASTVYSLAFLVFWAVIALASAATQWMGQDMAFPEDRPRRRHRRHQLGHSA